eukprot:249285_1
MSSIPELNNNVVVNGPDDSLFSAFSAFEEHLAVPNSSDRRTDSMLDTLSDSLTISALTAVKTKMKTYISNEKWRPPSFEIEIDDTDWLTPKFISSQSHKHMNLTQSITDKNTTFSPAHCEIDEFPNQLKSPKTVKNKKRNRRVKSQKFLKQKYKHKNKKNRKRNRAQSDTAQMGIDYKKKQNKKTNKNKSSAIVANFYLCYDQ